MGKKDGFIKILFVLVAVVLLIGVTVLVRQMFADSSKEEKVSSEQTSESTSEPIPTPNKYEEILANHEEPEIYATDTIKLYPKDESELPDGYMIPKPVRIDRNGENECYAYTIAMIYRSLGQEDAHGSEISKKIRKLYNGKEDIAAEDIEAFVNRSKKYHATLYTGYIDDLKHCLIKGVPVMILGRMSLEQPSYHYMAVTGYDQSHIYIADSYLFEEENAYYNRAVSYEEFSFMWDLEIDGYNHLFLQFEKKSPKKKNSVDGIHDAGFIGVQWTRTTDEDVEYLSFETDGSFYYSCACGNPVNDSDLIESYQYDEENQTITFHAIESTDTMVTKVKVLKYDKKHLKLDFDGDVREFRIENE